MEGNINAKIDLVCKRREKLWLGNLANMGEKYRNITEMGYEFMDFILKLLDIVAFVGVTLKQLLNVLDKLGYCKILEKSSAPPTPTPTPYPQEST